MIDHTPTEEHTETTDTNLRYIGYAARLKTIALSAKRYIAYSSDLGESIRPLTNPTVVRLTYGVAWSYILYDAVSETQHASKKKDATFASNSEVFVKRLTFQSVASMLLPSLTIHTTVRYVSKFVKDSANLTLRKWAPTAAGFAIIPFLPFMFDHPCEVLVDKAFDTAFEWAGYESPHKLKPEAAIKVPVDHEKIH